jgi:methionyl-tRNA formyltransferase
MKVVFFGSSRFVVPVLEMIHDQFDLPLVVTTEQNKMDAVPFFCESKKIQYLMIRKSPDLISNFRIEESMANIGIVADFGVLIPDQLLNSFPYGVINIHPSLLPKYRGPTPVQNAILNGDTETGVTIIKLDKYLDHGPVLAQVKETIKENDTAKSLYERLFKIGGQLLVKTLGRYENTQSLLVPQNHESATFTKALTRDDGFLDLKNIYEAKEFFEKMIRAYYPWPGVWTKSMIGDKLLLVKFLPEKKIQVEGKNEMGYKDFINGYANAADPDLINFLKKEL